MSNAAVLLIEELSEIKESLGDRSLAAIRAMLTDAEQVALRIQQESPEQNRRQSRHLAQDASAR